jgi:[ribosomal protein S5]-alanine N-acetyltransferase
MKLQVIKETDDNASELYVSADCQQVLSLYKDYYPKTGYNPPWVGYFVLMQNQVVGTCGFTGKPRHGKVEIAYWTFKQFEGQGVASFSCKELISIAWSNDSSLTITAKTAPEYNASTKILQKNGFDFKEIVQDEEIGDAWLWVLEK